MGLMTVDHLHEPKITIVNKSNKKIKSKNKSKSNAKTYTQLKLVNMLMFGLMI